MGDFARKEERTMKNSLKNRKRFAARNQKVQAAILKRDRAGRAANDPTAFTRAQAIVRIQTFGPGDEAEAEKFLHHRNKHVVARAEQKVSALSHVTPGELLDLLGEVPDSAPVGCGDPVYDDVPAPACCVDETLAEVLAEISEPVPLPEPAPVIIAAVNKCRTIKAVRELVAGVSNQAVVEAANARIEKLRSARKARKTKAA